MTVILFAGCASVRTRAAVPENLASEAHIAGILDARAFGDAMDERFVQSMVESVRQEAAYYRDHPAEKTPQRVDILAISGGGEDGAYGAGLLCGWTESGSRPQFKLVTGISTGALIAPWAFLGSSYDLVLRQSYTQIAQKDIFVKRGLLAVLNENALLDSSPLRKMVGSLVDDQILQSIAREHAKGRRLYIGTTELDSQRPVIWDMGAIASHGGPRALQLFQDVMIASASIPGAFPPVYLRVEAGGKEFEEMHVDGGTTAQVFLWGAGFSRLVAQERLGDQYANRPARLFIIRNDHVSPDWDTIGDRIMPIAARAISTLLKANGLNDLYRLYQVAQKNQMEYYLAYIPKEMRDHPREPFDNAYMVKLFALGHDKARKEYPWLREPPVNP